MVVSLGMGPAAAGGAGLTPLVGTPGSLGVSGHQLALAAPWWLQGKAGRGLRWGPASREPKPVVQRPSQVLFWGHAKVLGDEEVQ